MTIDKHKPDRSSRKRYETAVDLKTEAEVARILAEGWGKTLVKNPKKYGFDYSLLAAGGRSICPGRDSIEALVEIKCRNRVWDKKNATKKSPWYPDAILSAHKVGLARMAWPGPLIVVFRFPDIGLGRHLIKDPDHYTYRHAGRVDRGDIDDIEPVLSIPLDEIKIMYRWKERDESTSTRRSDNTRRTPEAPGEDQ